MTDSSAPNSSLETAQLNTVTNVSGGVNLDAGRVDVSGDVVGRDKVQSAGRDMLNVASGATVNNYYYASTSAISTGLSALSELMQRLPEVRRDVSVFQDVLGAAHEQIDLLRDYKDLHDLLHHLQFQFYDDILQEAPRFPADEITVEKFVRYQLNFTDFVTA
jgi:hypothetical protein